jgi:hypothetical protein
MKLLLLAFNFLVVLFVFNTFGAPQEVSAVIAGASTIYQAFKSKSTNMAFTIVGLDVSDVNTMLGSYFRTYAKDIQARLFRSIELEKYMRPVPNVKHEYISLNSTIGEVLQARQSQFTPKGEAVFTPRKNRVFPIKIDMLLDCLDELDQTYLGYLVEENLQAKDYKITKYIVNKLLIPKIAEEINFNSWNGVYVAPTPGTAGNSVDSVDGLNTIIDADIVAGNIVPIATGAITSTNILDKTEEFIESIDDRFQNMDAPILMSAINADRLWRVDRANNGGNSNYDGNSNLRVGRTGKEVVGLHVMNGSDKMIHTNNGNLLKMYDKITEPKMLNCQPDTRALKIFGDFKRGYGIGQYESFFVNDQD